MALSDQIQRLFGITTAQGKEIVTLQTEMKAVQATNKEQTELMRDIRDRLYTVQPIVDNVNDTISRRKAVWYAVISAILSSAGVALVGLLISKLGG